MGEAFAAKLRRAGVDVTQVRYAGIIHDFVMVNRMRDTDAVKAAVAQAWSATRITDHAYTSTTP